jgi:hypothetical protein
MDARGIDADPGWVNRELQNLRRQIEALRSERRAAATTISDGDLRLSNGASLVVDGGDVVLLDEDGSILFRLGPQEHGDRGFTLYREDGTVAVTAAKEDPTLPQALRILDASGNPLLTEWPFGNGAHRPRMPHPIHPAKAPAGWDEWGPHTSTTSATFERLWSGGTYKLNPLWGPRLYVWCSDATTAGEVKCVRKDTGTTYNLFLGGTAALTVAAGTTSPTLWSPAGCVLQGGIDARIDYAIEARVTAGAGSVNVAVPISMGH